MVPVLEQEKDRLRGVIAFVQAQIFLRFQVRIAVRLYTSLLFILVPIISNFVGRSRYSPKYLPPFDLTGDNKMAEMQFVAGVSFFLFDLVDAVYINRLFFRNTRDIAPRLKYLFWLMNQDPMLPIAMCSFAIVCGVMMFQQRWAW